MASVPEMDYALKDVSELMLYGREIPDIANLLSKLIDIGTPLLRIDADPAIAAGAGDFKVVYQLSEGMQALLTTARSIALERDKHRMEMWTSHD